MISQITRRHKTWCTPPPSSHHPPKKKIFIFFFLIKWRSCFTGFFSFVLYITLPTLSHSSLLILSCYVGRIHGRKCWHLTDGCSTRDSCSTRRAHPSPFLSVLIPFLFFNEQEVGKTPQVSPAEKERWQNIGTGLPNTCEGYCIIKSRVCCLYSREQPPSGKKKTKKLRREREQEEGCHSYQKLKKKNPNISGNVTLRIRWN